MALYALMSALSIYFVMQSLEAFAFRALLLGAVMWLGWRYAIGGGAVARAHGGSPLRPLPAPGARGSAGTTQRVVGDYVAAARDHAGALRSRSTARLPARIACGDAT
jgi:hypothetical protein